MIWDTFMFRNELDMLECRLLEFERWGDVKHIIVESPVTHQGEPKPMYFLENERRFWRWKDRIIHVRCNSIDVQGMSAWGREHAQRDAAQTAFSPQPDETVLISDVDEFPSLAFMMSGLPSLETPRVTLNQKLNMYAVDWEVPVEWPCQVAVIGSQLTGDNLAHIRDGREHYYRFNGGGRHLTWLGGPEEQAHKIAVTCHQEMNADERQRISSGLCYRTGIHHCGDVQLLGKDVDPTWPEYIRHRCCPESWFRPR